MLERREYQIEHMIWLFAMRRNNTKSDVNCSRPVAQMIVIILPHALAPALNTFPRFDLGIQKRSENIRRQIAGSHIYPCVFVHLAAKEPAAIRALLANNLS